MFLKYISWIKEQYQLARFIHGYDELINQFGFLSLTGCADRKSVYLVAYWFIL